ncbi:MAG: sialate O-acetylesterase [Pirellulales bacterium]|nr:sialate O-acetylesterase [Pirellulales bacterium]
MFAKRLLPCLGLVAVLAGLAAPATAEIKLPAVLGDNMVLQRDVPVPIWGWAEPGEDITVQFAGQTAKTKAGEDGRWQVKLEPLAVGEPAELIITGSASGKRTLTNVLVGEVWVCSGQSNMEMSLRAVANGEAEVAEAKHPRIRLFMVENVVADKPASDCKGTWAECAPATVGNFSAVGYFFGRDLLTKLDVPVGLIDSTWGGTPAESWTSREALEAKPALAPLLKRWDDAVAADANAAVSPHRPAGLYNGMIAPLLPYALRGAIWYQGESNVGRAHQYRTLFPTMIEDWRSRWGQPEMPFGFVQIAPFDYGSRGAEAAACAELWEAQLMTVKNVPAVGMAVTMDIGELKDIHPRNKQDVGKRLALWALATIHGQSDLVHSGPIYKSMKVEGDAIRLSFDHAGGGLATLDGKAPSEFTIAGADEVFHPAEAKIDGDTLVVRGGEVKEPVAVRFAWHHSAQPNLINKERLPASPFRTDSWKGVTEGRD